MAYKLRREGFEAREKEPPCAPRKRSCANDVEVESENRAAPAMFKKVAEIIKKNPSASPTELICRIGTGLLKKPRLAEDKTIELDMKNIDPELTAEVLKCDLFKKNFDFKSINTANLVFKK